MNDSKKAGNSGLLTLGEWYKQGGVQEVKKRFFSRHDNSMHYQVLEERDCGVEGLLFGINYVDENGKLIPDAVDWIAKERHFKDPEYTLQP